MAKKSTKRRDGKTAGLIAGGAAFLLYAATLGFHGPLSLMVGAGIAAVVGSIIKIMATPMKGLDKNAKARDEMAEAVIEDEYAREVVEAGVKMLDQLKAARDGINEYVFSRRIDELRAAFDQLLRAVIEDPDKAGRIRKFNTYYFPTALKMLGAYQQKKVKGTSYMAMSATREDILNMLDDLTAATKKLHGTMLQADLEEMDVEMDVFDRMLKSDGLTEDELVEDMRTAAHQAAKDIPMSKAPGAKPVAAPAAQPEAPQERTPAPVLNVPMTASAAQLSEGTPVLEMPELPHAPDFQQVRAHNETK